MSGDGGRDLRLAAHAVLLRRSPSELQVGVEPSVVVPLGYDPLLRALAAGTDRAGLDATAARAGLPVDVVPLLLGHLGTASLLRPTPVTARRAVRVVGAGALAARTAHELLASGFTTVYLADLPDHARRTSGASRARVAAPAAQASDPDRLDLLRATLADAWPRARVRRSRHFVQPEGDAVALTVVVADGPEPDRLVTDLLRDAGAPHLLLRCAGDEAVVGPLVVPGATPCVRCADLARRDVDPRWPWLLDQLVRLRFEPGPTLLAWAAVTATVQALAFVGGGEAETVGQTLELGTAQHTMRLRAWAPHADCPCRWAAAPTTRALPG